MELFHIPKFFDCASLVGANCAILGFEKKRVLDEFGYGRNETFYDELLFGYNNPDRVVGEMKHVSTYAYESIAANLKKQSYMSGIEYIGCVTCDEYFENDFTKQNGARFFFRSPDKALIVSMLMLNTVSPSTGQLVKFKASCHCQLDGTAGFPKSIKEVKLAARVGENSRQTGKRITLHSGVDLRDPYSLSCTYEMSGVFKSSNFLHIMTVLANHVLTIYNVKNGEFSEAFPYSRPFFNIRWDLPFLEEDVWKNINLTVVKEA